MKTALLNALAGSSSQKPVDIEKLLLLGDIDVIGMHLDAMRGTGEINSAQITRHGLITKYYWLTGVINPPVKGAFVINKHTQRDADLKHKAALLPIKVQEKTSISPTEKEKVMTDADKPGVKAGELTQEIYAQIVANPGILLPDLARFALDKFPGINQTKITKAIDNLWRSAKRTRREWSEEGCAMYFANDVAKKAIEKPAKPAATPKSKPAQVVATPPAQADVAPASPCAKPQPAGAGDFSLMLSDENCLFINLGDEVFRLDPHQLARLDRFLARVMPNGVRMPDGVPA